MKRVRVLLADDHRIVRDGLRALLALESDVVVVGEAGDGEEALRAIPKTHPQVVVMDIGMPKLNGIEATRRITEDYPEIRVIGLSIHSDRPFVKGMLTAGAKGYLLKNCASDELVQAIREVMAGRIHVSPQASGVVVEDYVRQVQGEPVCSLLLLSEREIEVLRLLSLGRQNKQVAASLGISPKTVETHRRHITEKLGMNSIADLTRFALREGLISAE